MIKNLTRSGVLDKDTFYRELSRGRIEELAGVPCLVFSDKDDRSKLAYYVFNPKEPCFSRITTHLDVDDSLWEYFKLIGVSERLFPDTRTFRVNDIIYYQHRNL